LAGTGAENQGFRSYLQVLRERIWLVLACVVIATGAAVAYVETAPKEYTAQAQMLVSPVPSDNATLFDLPVLHGSNDPTQDVLTASSLMSTPQIAQATAKALGLSQAPSAVLAQVQVLPLGQSNLVSIQAVAPTASRAQALANGFAREIVATRTGALHAAIATILPGLKAQAAALPTTQRNGVGTLGDQVSQLQQLQHGPDPTVSIASLAERPSGPSSPKTHLSIIAGLLAGLIIGIGAAFAFHALDPRLRREEQIRQVFDAPILARIPREPIRKFERPRLPIDLSFAAQEGYRTLRTMLTSSAAGEPRVYLVTGSSPSEGKTTSAISLAISLAHAGSRVILIEADLRRPMIAATLGVQSNYGTEHVLDGQVQLADALTTTTLEGASLGVLTVHQAGVQTVDRMSFGVARRLIRDARRLADFVVIDSPPLTTVIDALPLAQLADEVLVVVRLNVSRMNKLNELRELLASQPTKGGIVLIGGSPRRSSPYYYAHTSEAAEPSPSGSPRRVGAARTWSE
jgi:succinoglycan biosynthesis transport protein ExoP